MLGRVGELAKLVVRLQVCTGAKQITEGAKRIASVAKYANHDERSDEKDTTKLGDGQQQGAGARHLHFSLMTRSNSAAVQRYSALFRPQTPLSRWAPHMQLINGRW